LAASDDDAIGEVITRAVEHVGEVGVITTEESDTLGLTVDVVDGIEFDHGYISAYMVTNPERMEAVLENPVILLTNKKITAVQEIMPTIEAAKRADRPLVVLAEDVDGPALQLLVGGNMHRTMQSVVVRAPGFGHRTAIAELEDSRCCIGRSCDKPRTPASSCPKLRWSIRTCDESRCRRTRQRSTVLAASRRLINARSDISRPQRNGPGLMRTGTASQLRIAR
jgi:chaperonin GroEL